MNSDLNYVTISSSKSDETLNGNLSYHIHLSDLEKTYNLDNHEKHMLRTLLQNGVVISLCGFNDNGYVEILTLNTNKNISSNIIFPYLQDLEVTSSFPSSADFIIRHYKSLTSLSLHRNNLKKIPDLLKLQNLMRLNVTYNKLKTINDFGFLPNLQELELSHNNINSLSESNSNFSLKALKYLGLNQNNFVTLNGFEKLENCISLQSIHIAYNFINELNKLNSISVLKQLEFLDLSHNKIEDVNISAKVPCLESLLLNHNNITKISNFSNLSRIKNLFLSNNKLTFVDFNRFNNISSLERVYFGNNPIRSISGLENLPPTIKIYYISFDEFTKSELKSFKSYIKSFGWKIFGEFIARTPPPQAELNINKYLTVRLEEGTINLYVNGKIFDQCIVLPITIPYSSHELFDDIESIDEAADIFEKFFTLDYKHPLIPLQTQFFVHASNIQAWVDNNYNTRLLHRNLAFPLLKELSKAGDNNAKMRFREEIAKRYTSGCPTVIKYLKEEGYLDYLSKEELSSLNKV